MAVYITGDLHGRLDRIHDFCQGHHTSKEDDWMIVLGDAGANFYNDIRDKFTKREFEWAPIKFFLIRGNHEMRPEDVKGCEKIVLTRGDVQGVFWYDPDYPHMYFAIDGYEYQIGCHRALVCGGAYSVDKFYRLEHGWPWFENEQPNKLEKQRVRDAALNARKNSRKDAFDYQRPTFDLVLTHTCPTRFIPTELFLPGIDQSKVDHSTEDFFDEIYDLLPDPKPHWYFGHYHGDKIGCNYRMLYNDIVRLS